MAPVHSYTEMFRPNPHGIVREMELKHIDTGAARSVMTAQRYSHRLDVQRGFSTLGYAFSQGESGQADIMRTYDTTQSKPVGD